MTFEQQNFDEKFLETLQSTIPFALILLMLTLNIGSATFVNNITLKTPLFLMAIYYWALFYPAIMPSWLAFAGGIILDLIFLTPIGLNALICTAGRRFVISQRNYIANQSFILIWSIFAILYTTSVIITFTISGDNSITRFLASDTIISLIMNIMIFPLCYSLLHISYSLFQAKIPSRLERKRKNIILKKGSSSKRRNKIQQ